MKWKWNNYNIQHVQMIDLNRSVRKFINWTRYVESSLFKFFDWICEQYHLFFSANCCVSKYEILSTICHFTKKLSIANNNFFKIFSTLMKRNDVSKTLFTWIIIKSDL